METSGIIHLQHECSESTSFFQHSLIKWNWGECGLWELRVLANCGPNSQNLPSFSRIHWKKNGKSLLKIGFGNLGSIPPEGRISLRIYLSFLEFTKKICFYKICKFRHFFHISQRQAQKNSSCSCKFLVYFGRVSFLIETSLRNDYNERGSVYYIARWCA